MSVRALWSIESLHENSIWGKRWELEELIYRKEEIVAYFSCITALVMKNSGQKRKRVEEKDNSDFSGDSEEEDFVTQPEAMVNRPGLSFWLVLDCPNYTLG